MRIIVDAFGGDNAPLEILKGSAMAVQEYGVELLVTGPEAEIRRFFAEREQHPGGAVAPESMSWEGHRRQFIEFSEAIADKTALKTPGEEGLRTVALVRAVYDSASSGRPVAPEAC